MASVPVKSKFSLLSADGEATGWITIPNTEGWLVGAVVWLRSTTEDPLKCVIAEKSGVDRLRLRRFTSGSDASAFTDVSGYVTGDSASVSMATQTVAILPTYQEQVKA